MSEILLAQMVWSQPSWYKTLKERTFCLSKDVVYQLLAKDRDSEVLMCHSLTLNHIYSYIFANNIYSKYS